VASASPIYATPHQSGAGNTPCWGCRRRGPGSARQHSDLKYPPKRYSVWICPNWAANVLQRMPRQEPNFCGQRPRTQIGPTPSSETEHRKPPVTKGPQMRLLLAKSQRPPNRRTAWWAREGFRNQTNSMAYCVPPLLAVPLIAKDYFQHCPTDPAPLRTGYSNPRPPDSKTKEKR
jgi:hypothetical protein